MSVAKIVEITSESKESFEQAMKEGVARAGKTLKNMKSAWISEQQLSIEEGQIVGYRVTLKIVFVLAD